MASSKLSSLTAASALTGTELFYADDGTHDVKVTASQIRTFAASTGSSNVIDVQRDYGATGNGTTDDTTAVQNALDAAMATGAATNIVYFPPGTYKLSPIKLYRNDNAQVSLRIEGSSTLKTVLQFNVAVNVNAITTSQLKYFSIKNLKISGTGGTGNGLFMTNLAGSGTGTNAGVLEGLLIANFDYGTVVGDTSTAGSEITYINCEWTSCTSTGLWIGNANSLNQNLFGCAFSACGNGLEVHRGGSINFFGGGSAGNAIDFKINATGTYMIHGWRSEGATNRFLFVQPGASGGTVDVVGCTAVGDSSTVMVETDGAIVSIRNSFIGGEIHYVGHQGVFLTLDGCGIYDTVPFVPSGGNTSPNYYRVRGCYQANGVGDATNVANFADDTGLCLSDVAKSGQLEIVPTTVSGLPSAATAGVGARAFVTDANSTTFLATAAGSGSNKVPVFSDGTNWLIG